jgi:transcription initiation factor TFIID subunit 10
MASAPPENPDQVPTVSGDQAPDGEEVNPPPEEAKMPTRKDMSLKEFLNKMDDYAPIVRLPSAP